MEGIGLKELFDQLYREDEEFRDLVSEIRKMVLDPGSVFDSELALTLFNRILAKLGLPPTTPAYLRPRKTVLVRAREPIPRPPRCITKPSLPEIVVLQPLIDVERGNALTQVYACQYFRGGHRVTEVTLVFGDEDRPPSGSKLDVWYDAWRLVSWGRIRDLETFYIVEKEGAYEVDFTGLQLILKETLGVRKIPPIGSGKRRFHEPGHEYEVEVVKGETITIYVNTWNHALSTVDTNPGLEKLSFRLEDVGFRVGSRVRAENDNSDIKYISEIPGL